MRGRARWVFLLAAVLIAACSNPSPVMPTATALGTPSASPSTSTPGPATTRTSAGASSSPTASSAPNIACAEVAGDLCQSMAAAAIRAVGDRGAAVTNVWLSSGALCPVSADCLFDPNANFPPMLPPDGGNWLGSAELAFAGAEEHAGISLAQVGDQIVAKLLGYRVPPLTWCSGSCPSSATTDGPFRLELVMPRTVWHSADPISGRAILSYDGQEPTEIAASSQAVITFVYVEIGGERTFSYPISADCKPYTLDPATPIGEPVRMSALPGATNATLPPGNWTITAVAQFAGGPDAAPSPFSSLDLCRSVQHELRTSVALTVLD